MRVFPFCGLEIRKSSKPSTDLYLHSKRSRHTCLMIREGSNHGMRFYAPRFSNRSFKAVQSEKLPHPTLYQIASLYLQPYGLTLQIETQELVSDSIAGRCSPLAQTCFDTAAIFALKPTVELESSRLRYNICDCRLKAPIGALMHGASTRADDKAVPLRGSMSLWPQSLQGSHLYFRWSTSPF